MFKQMLKTLKGLIPPATVYTGITSFLTAFQSTSISFPVGHKNKTPYSYIAISSVYYRLNKHMVAIIFVIDKYVKNQIWRRWSMSATDIH